MTTQEKLNLIDIKDYLSMRERGVASNVSWQNVKHLNLPNGRTFWQMFAQFEDYDDRFEPCLKQLRTVFNQIVKL